MFLRFNGKYLDKFIPGLYHAYLFPYGPTAKYVFGNRFRFEG
jgi:hypothetical protein